MKKLVIVALLMLLAGCVGDSSPKMPELDGTYTGQFFTIKFPKTYRVTPIDGGVAIEGGIKFNLFSVKEPKSQLGSVMPLRVTLERRKKAKDIHYLTLNFNGFDAVKMEGMDDMKRYTFGIYIPLDGGMLILELDPAFMKPDSIDFSHRIAETLNITDQTWFERNK